MADETISQAISDIRKQFPNMDGLDSEEDVKLFVIERVLEALDWNLRQRREVRKEYPVGRGRADYALNPDLPTAAFI
jgi:predicted type IV restriction endonuclease